ncbi:uncharacterized protein LOC110836499 [Zootermopsis nevadensis]|uniref:ADP-ribosylation factor-like protein 6-interacting protein 6 n=1 Tax=Zootermopsis nevadensis TaxID=136037 RepID=A0A067QQH7_ZOONE|nr:uncharacterized protein LOC110836499 [Zootermopsis nevadensis]KDR12138.1 ADP-ribosylation factor-like protein 6-interacting protein 6 [Zootermopsis nevadensis]
MFKKRQQYLTKYKEESHVQNGHDLSFSNEDHKAARRYCTELKLALFLFYVSFIIVCSKLVLVNREFFQNSYVHCKTYWATSSFGTYRLLSDDNKIKISELLLTSNSVVRDYVDHLKWLLLPLLAGIGVTILTWNIIYIDSYIPGINPPTPFSPTKNRKQHSSRFPLVYIIAIVNGFLVFLLMVFHWY